jgi:RNA polymerase sigma-70 factor (ECF subfamily)
MDTSASLLERLTTSPNEESWRRLDDLYRPLIRSWLLREPSLRGDVDDLVQDVMTVLVRELAGFRRQRLGSFRRWLKAITVHRLQGHRRASRQRMARQAPLVARSLADQLADPHSALSRQWDQEHNAHVVRRLLELIEDSFAPKTVVAFRRLVFDGIAPKQVAEELEMTVHAVAVAKSKVLARLRQEAKGFLD